MGCNVRAATIAAAFSLGAAPGALAPAPAPAGPNHTFADGSQGFAFSTQGGVLNPGLLVEFNPQPKPPGFGAQFGYSLPQDPAVAFPLTEGDTPLTLTLAGVPEPGAWTLMILGVAGVGGGVRSRRRTPVRMG